VPASTEPLRPRPAVSFVDDEAGEVLVQSRGEVRPWHRRTRSRAETERARADGVTEYEPSSQWSMR
jgi:hypothetical protein